MRCAPITQNCMLSYEHIFSRIRWNFSLHEGSVIATRPNRPMVSPAIVGRLCQAPLVGRRFKENALQLLRLRDDSKIRLRRFPALRITPLRLLVGDRASDD